MAALVGSLAKNSETLLSQLDGTTAKVSGIKDQLEATKRRAASAIGLGLAAKELVAGLFMGSLGLLFFGAYLALSRVIDPAVAALALGGACLLVLFGIALWLMARADAVGAPNWETNGKSDNKSQAESR